jgi:hypothetical protein
MAAKLEYTFKNDTLFKMLFVKNPDLLKRFVFTSGAPYKRRLVVPT